MRKKFYRIFVTLAVVFLAVSALYAVTPFEVSSTIPTNGATGVALDQAFTVTFNQDVECSTVTTSTFTLKSGTAAVEGTIVCYGAVTTFTPSTQLAANTRYTATVTDTVKDVGGNTLAANFVGSFKTGSSVAAPTVTAVAPLNHATGAGLNAKIAAAFDQAMTPATIDASNFELTGPGTTPVSGVITYNSTNNIATFAPSAHLLAKTKYTATIKTSVTNLAGAGMDSPFVWTFTTGAASDVTPPTVISTNPLNGATNVPLNHVITATFSKAMAPATISGTTFTLKEGVSLVPVAGAVAYAAVGNMAMFTPTVDLAPSKLYTATVTIGVDDLAGNHLVSKYVWTFTTGLAKATLPPTVVSTSPVSNAKLVCLNGAINATFSEPLDPVTINTGTFTVTGPAGAPVLGTVSLSVTGTIATLTPLTTLEPTTPYTATITKGVTDVLGEPLEAAEVWSFTTGTTACVAPVALNSAAPFGAFGGGAGITNQGIHTVINGDIGTTAVSTKVTGFHDNLVAYVPPSGCIYTQTTLNIGDVTGQIYTAPPPPTVSCPNEGTAATLVIASAAAADALTAYNTLAGLPKGPLAGAGQLGGLTLAPGTYTSATSYTLTGSDLTLDAKGNANAVWVFQMGSTLTVGAPAAPRNVTLINGAQAKNVFWQVGSAATINGAGGGTMVGTIIAKAGVTFSTAGNAAITTLNGRALGLNASVTMVNTVINVPAP
jgi:hypothetical protein